MNRKIFYTAKRPGHLSIHATKAEAEMHKGLVKRHIINVDDLEDYLPDYEVEVTIEYKKTITVTVKGDEAGNEEEAEVFAQDQAENGEYDKKLDDEMHDDFTVRYCVAQEVEE